MRMNTSSRSHPEGTFILIISPFIVHCYYLEGEEEDHPFTFCTGDIQEALGLIFILESLTTPIAIGR